LLKEVNLNIFSIKLICACRQFEELLDDEEEEVQCNTIDSIKYAVQKLSIENIKHDLFERFKTLLKGECGMKVDEKLIDLSGEIIDAVSL